MIDSSNIKDWGVRNRNIGNDAPKFQHTYETFRHDSCAALRGGGAAAGSTGARNILNFGSMNQFEQHVKGAGQTIITPVLTDVGLDIGQDQTATEGIELTQGITQRAKHAYKIGTDGPFFLRVKAKVADGSGCNPFHIGFRKAEAYQTAYTAYADYALVGIVGGDATPKIKTETEVGGGGTTTTDTGTTWPDASTHELKVCVDLAGKVTYFRDGIQLTAPPAYTFTAGLYVVPSIFFLHGADLCDTLELIEYECGLVAPVTKVRRVKA